VSADFPGVMPEGADGGDDSPGGELTGSSIAKVIRAGAAASGALPGRKAGRGAASVGAGEAGVGRPEGGIATGDPALDGATVPEQPEAAEPFTFAGKTWASPAEAEQHLQRLDANLRATQKRLSETERTAREAISVATAWQQHGSSGVRQDRQPDQPKAPAAPETPWYQDPQVFDLDFVRSIADEQGIDTALLYAFQTADKVYTDRFSKLLDERLQPFTQEREVGRVYQGAMNAFHTVADDVDAAGTPAYPELHSQDPAVHEMIVRIWRQMGKAGLEMGEDAVRVAVLKYRRGVAAGQFPPPDLSSVTPPAPSAPSAARAVQGLQAARAASSQVLSGTGTPRPAAPGEDTPAAKLKASLRAAGKPVLDRSGFNMGFSAD
jgi:hypothetical protein